MAVHSFFNEDKQYSVACGTVRELHEREFGEGICSGCPHYSGGNNLLCNVHGPIPTKSYTNNFRRQHKDEQGNYQLDYDSFVAEDAAGYFYNKYRKIIRRVGGRFFLYMGEMYEFFSDDLGKLKGYTSAALRKIYSTLNITTLLVPHEIRLLKALDSVLSREIPEEEAPNDMNYIAFDNGVFHLDTGKFTGFGPEYLITDKIGVTYGTGKKCPNFLALLELTLMAQDKIDLLQFFFGLSLSNYPVNEIQKFLWTYGEPGTGKTTILNALGDIIQMGEGNTDAFIRLPANDNPAPEIDFRYDLGKVKALVIDDLKLRNDKKRIERFEEWVVPFVSTPTQSCRVLYKTSFQALNRATIFISTNSIPGALFRRGEGLLRRLRSLKLDYVLTRDEGVPYVKKCKEELEGIVNWGLQGLLNALDRVKNGGELIPPLTEEERVFRRNEIIETTGEDDVLIATLNKFNVGYDKKGVYLKDFVKRYHAHPNALAMTTSKEIKKLLLLQLSKRLRKPSTLLWKRKAEGMWMAGIEPKGNDE